MQLFSIYEAYATIFLLEKQFGKEMLS